MLIFEEYFDSCFAIVQKGSYFEVCHPWKIWLFVALKGTRFLFEMPLLVKNVRQ